MRPLAILVTASCSLFLSAGGILAQEAPRQPTESKSNLFDPVSGQGEKCYVVTRDDIQFGERPGVDPATGRPCRPVTPEVLERIRAYNWGNRPRKIEATDPTFFSLRTGEAVVWYSKKENGVVELFDLMGFDPDTGEELLPVTREVVALWKKQNQPARQPPQPIDPDKYAPFDPVSGKPRAWYSRTGAGEYHFYDNPGYDPRTGDPLAVVTRDVIDAWRASLVKPGPRQAPQLIDLDKYPPFDSISGEPHVWYSGTSPGEYKFYDQPGHDPRTGEPLTLITRDIVDAWHNAIADGGPSKKCYIITRDAAKPVQYRERAGTDSETGRQCRPVTAEILERLREYEKGKRPTRIATGEPTFFDPRTGEPIIWHVRNQRGDIELFDLMGFHPSSGEELVPVTREVADLWKEQSGRRPPKLIDPAKHEWFDPLTGEPRVWYWRNENGDYEYYDNPGYHPRTGEPLTRLTKAEAARVRKQMGMRADQGEKERRCDELAANPMDQNRKAGEKGVTFEALKEQAREAIEACESASKQSPNELRFLYQRARALQTVDRPKALELLKILITKRYPAAFDNVGWLLITERKDYAEAAKHFRMGVQLGDPDAMASLAEMIVKGHAAPKHEGETIELLKRAARLGHVGAARALEQEQQPPPELGPQRSIQREGYVRLHDFFRGFMPVVPRPFPN
jgi:hypothetical protein